MSKKKVKKNSDKSCNCWSGYERVPGTEPCGPNSCKKKGSSDFKEGESEQDQYRRHEKKREQRHARKGYNVDQRIKSNNKALRRRGKVYKKREKLVKTAGNVGAVTGAATGLYISHKIGKAIQGRKEKKRKEKESKNFSENNLVKKAKKKEVKRKSLAAAYKNADSKKRKQQISEAYGKAKRKKRNALRKTNKNVNFGEITKSNQPGKKWKKKVNGKTYHAGDSNYTISPGTSRGDSYCARSYGIKKKHGSTPKNEMARKKWKCRGKKSVK